MDSLDIRLLRELEHGLPFVPEPFEEIGSRLGLTGADVQERIRKLKSAGIVRKFTARINQRLAGISANALVAWKPAESPHRDIGPLYLATLDEGFRPTDLSVEVADQVGVTESVRLSTDVIEAALSVGIDDLLEAVERTKALARFTARPGFGDLAAAVKRVANIIKEPETAPVDASLFKNPAEGTLFAELVKAEADVGSRLARSDFAAAIESMARLKPMIDSFFDSVLVMDKDDSVRRNRLALLTRTRDLFARMADFRKIQTP